MILNTDFIPLTDNSSPAHLSKVYHTHVVHTIVFTQIHIQQLYDSHSACQIQIGLSCKKWQKHVYQHNNQTVPARNIIWLMHGQVSRWWPLHQTHTQACTYMHTYTPNTGHKERGKKKDERRGDDIRWDYTYEMTRLRLQQQITTSAEQLVAEYYPTGWHRLALRWHHSFIRWPAAGLHECQTFPHHRGG